MKKRSQFTCLALLVLFLLPVAPLQAQMPVREHLNNAHHVLNFLLINDTDIKTLSARKGETLTGSIYKHNLEPLNARKITFYRNNGIHKIIAPEDEFLSGLLHDSRFGTINLSDLGVHRIELDKKGDIVSLHTYENDIIEGKIGPYILSTFDSHYITFNADGKLIQSKKK